MTTETERAIRELELAGMFDADSDYDGGIGKSVTELLMTLQSLKCSGMVHDRIVSVFSVLAEGGILTPLKGTPNEWEDMSDYCNKQTFQNKRCTSVFADTDTGKNAIDIHGKVFIPINGASYTNTSRSKVPVYFPYTPKTKYIYEGGSITTRLKRWIKKTIDNW